ncbi:hypothetical protein AMS68_004689 [Peltaster fructicola]|uniref:Phosphatidylethanolamine N-methyltransferase n=1 Tax=Peltaster fructicola TaxID=286661 RepID=A0A6H0XWM1_9PEZI|nr:hypothetical protein AMS68_004689 [Peltaster fructicola]
MSTDSGIPAIVVEELRERIPRQAESEQDAESATAQDRVKSLNSRESKRDEQDQKTYGRTPNGTVFIVPHTEDMVSQLFDPSQPKNASDIAIVTVLLTLVALLYLLPQSLRVPVFAVISLFWRSCYNFGIGWLLHMQSHHKRLVHWAERSKIFNDPAKGDNPRPFLYNMLKHEMEAKILSDYKFPEAPIEYNTWLLFRRVVDLILMCDFTTFCCFTIACAGQPTGENIFMTLARWVSGIVLVLFNLWVKLDAHRVVKDYAWYWGDFFYMIDQDLTFDGVFELAPHPMYSVGYVGLYGFALMAASYKVLFMAIVAHAAQLTFLTLVENPHIERTYNAPAPVKREDEVDPQHPVRPAYTSRLLSAGHVNGYPPLATTHKPSPLHNLIGIQNMDLHRVPDLAILMLQLLMYSVAFLSPNNLIWQSFFVVLATLSRLWYSVGIGLILDDQSNRKSWTRHFIKYGESTEEAWRQWRGVYHISMVFCWTSFICATWKMYALPPDWSYGMATLRHVVGCALIALHVWTITEIYDSLGEFGWFFGDFFFDKSSELTYDGIYRFLNNPERTIGLAGVWGAAIITWSKAIFFLALLSHVLTLCFIQFVERPHMQKRYRQGLRQTSGVSKNLQRSLPKPLQHWHDGVNKTIDETVEFLEDLVESARPKLATGLQTFVKDSKTLFQQYPARITITRLAPDLAGFDPKRYSLKIDTTYMGVSLGDVVDLDREGETAHVPKKRRDSLQRLTIEYGCPIKVKWTAPLNHSKQDWVGLYMVSENSSREVTKVSSQGRWTSTTKNGFDLVQASQGILVEDIKMPGINHHDGEVGDVLTGEIEFAGDKLWWTSGVFEFRYHHGGKHNVMASSRPFEIRVSRFDDEDLDPEAESLYRAAVEHAILPVVQNCFDRDPNYAPRTVDESYGKVIEREGKFARRVVYAIQQMFGIEFAPEVVQADGNVRNLAWRICTAKKVLAPYSMSRSKGRSTPAE